MADYDAVIVMALAAVAAKSTSPAMFNAWIPAVTTPASGKTVVHSFAEGLRALQAGKHIQYIRAGGIIDFNPWHNKPGGFELASYHTTAKISLIRSVTTGQRPPLVPRP